MKTLCDIVRRTGKEVRFEVYCSRCGKTPVLRMHKVGRYRWLEKLPHWRNVDCGSLKCALMNYFGEFIGRQRALKTRLVN